MYESYEEKEGMNLDMVRRKEQPRIRILILYPSRIQGSKKYQILNPGSGSTTLLVTIFGEKGDVSIYR
jgi:hypothetical protein